MDDNEPEDPALAGTAAGAVQGGGRHDATEGPRDAARTGESGEGVFDTGEFVLDHDAEPPGGSTTDDELTFGLPRLDT